MLTVNRMCSSSVRGGGADAIFPEARHHAEMIREFALCRPGVLLLANMTECGRIPFFTAAEFAEMGYTMANQLVVSLRIVSKASTELYAAIKRDGGTQNKLEVIQTRKELCGTIKYHF